MGSLVEGRWQARDNAVSTTGGGFERRPSSFRSWITPDGAAGPTGASGFRAKPGRYHLYAALACPWAHRALAMRRLKGLEEAITLSVVNPHMGGEGWTFAPERGVIPDSIHGADTLHEVYTAADPAFTGRVTVPVLWDRERGTIVNNESSEIIRMLNDAFDGVGARTGDYYPQGLRAEIDAVNERVYGTLNNGVYRAGFATTQDAYAAAFGPLFDTLDWLEGRLSAQRFLVGDRLTEADIRLWTTLVRFDAVYHGHFKCNRRRIVDYPNLWGFTRDLYGTGGLGQTVDLDHIKRHYYGSHRAINPTGIVPLGPDIDFAAPHDRAARWAIPVDPTSARS